VTKGLLIFINKELIFSIFLVDGLLDIMQKILSKLHFSVLRFVSWLVVHWVGTLVGCSVTWLVGGLVV